MEGAQHLRDGSGISPCRRPRAAWAPWQLPALRGAGVVNACIFLPSPIFLRCFPLILAISRRREDSATIFFVIAGGIGTRGCSGRRPRPLGTLPGDGNPWAWFSGVRWPHKRDPGCGIARDRGVQWTRTAELNILYIWTELSPSRVQVSRRCGNRWALPFALGGMVVRGYRCGMGVADGRLGAHHMASRRSGMQPAAVAQ